MSSPSGQFIIPSKPDELFDPIFDYNNFTAKRYSEIGFGSTMILAYKPGKTLIILIKVM